MRVPTTDAPRRSWGPRVWLVVAAIVLLLLITSMRGIARFYTDYLWFHEVHFGHTWRSLLGAKIVPALIFSAIFFVLMLVNLYIADRIAPRGRAMGTEDEIIEKYRTYVAPYAGRLRVGVSLFFAIVMGGGVSSQWRDWILFANAVKFHQKDPQFHRDIGFYVFKLPFLEFAVGWAFAALLVVLIVTAVFHYVNGGIRLQHPFHRVTPQVKVHLSVILALMALTKTVQYYLARFELLFSHRGVVDGAGYTDVKAQLPALNLLMIISVAAAVLFIANIFRRGWVFPIIAVGLWGFISIVVGTIYPAYIQRFQVQPNEYAREQPYIARNIAATRVAFGLSRISAQPFDYKTNLDQSDIRDNLPTLENARLWDPDQMRDTYQALQALKPYLTFNDVDVDRYASGVDRVPALLATRELDPSQLPSRTWTNSHLVYTHGYGSVVAAGNAVNNSDPSFLLSDIPPTGEVTLNRPQVYFGEGIGGFAVVHTGVREIDPTDTTTRYAGDGGVQVSNFVRKAALALRFGDWNLFVSGQLTSNSRVIYNRDIMQRVKTAAPFLRYDGDPYSVVLNGRIVWVVDAYTTTNRYPYSQSIHPRSLANGSGLDTDFNYVRNSVKATIDAYDGTVKFYVIDDTDPIIRAYEKAFPDLFTKLSDAPRGLRDHFRYPEDMFNTQTEQYTLYHMTRTRQFYNKDDLWDIAAAPSANNSATANTTVTTNVSGNNGGRNSTLSSGTNPIPSLYQMMQLPNEHDQEFVLTRPFAPRGKTNQLTAFLAARSDPKNYGKLVVYNLPDNSPAPSPLRAATLIDSTPAISRQFTLLSTQGSALVRGNMQLLPIGDSVIFVRPIWVVGEGTSSYPRFRYVAMSYGDSAVLASSVDQGLTALFGQSAVPGQQGVGPTTNPRPGGTTTGNENASVVSLLQRARAEYTAALAALKDGDLAAYQSHIKTQQSLIDQAFTAAQKAPASSGSATTTTTTTGVVGTATTTTAKP